MSGYLRSNDRFPLVARAKNQFDGDAGAIGAQTPLVLNRLDKRALVTENCKRKLEKGAISAIRPKNSGGSTEEFHEKKQ
jgi:hypothetical protein